EGGEDERVLAHELSAPLHDALIYGPADHHLVGELRPLSRFVRVRFDLFPAIACHLLGRAVCSRTAVHNTVAGPVGDRGRETLMRLPVAERARNVDRPELRLLHKRDRPWRIRADNVPRGDAWAFTEIELDAGHVRGLDRVHSRQARIDSED